MNLRTLDLELPDGHAINSIAFHPDQEVLAVAVTGPAKETGEIRLIDLHGKTLAHYAAGYGPDDVHFSPSGDRLVAANEAEEYWIEGEEWQSNPGSVTLVNLTGGLLEGVAKQVQFKTLPDRHGP